MIDQQAVDLINRELKVKFGLDPQGRELFRLVWGNDQFEVRHRTVVKHDAHGNYTGEQEETLLLHKYPTALNCLVLEKSLIRVGWKPEDVKTWNGYEMIWLFKNMKTNEPQSPNLMVCLFICSSLLYGPTKTAKDYYDEDKQCFKKEVEEFYEELDDHSPYLATMLHNKEAIVVPGKDHDND